MTRRSSMSSSHKYFSSCKINTLPMRMRLLSMGRKNCHENVILYQVRLGLVHHRPRNATPKRLAQRSGSEVQTEKNKPSPKSANTIQGLLSCKTTEKEPGLPHLARKLEQLAP